MISEWTFGTLADGRDVTAYELRSKSGLRAVVLNYGATLQALYLPDGTNITLGYEGLAGYVTSPDYRGAFIGRNANRIAGAAFEIDGKNYEVPANEGDNNLHSGPNGFDRQLWDAAMSGEVLHLKHISPERDQGFPGRLSVGLQISFVEDTLRLDMTAETDAPTPVNLTWHPYWNLNGHGRIDGHDLRVSADTRTVLDKTDPLAVKDTRFDFKKSLPVGQVRLDDNYSEVGEVTLRGAEASLTVTSSLPDMQVYSGDHLQIPRSGLAIEPQYRPNDINLAKKSLLRPGEVYRHWIEYQLSGHTDAT